MLHNRKRTAEDYWHDQGHNLAAAHRRAGCTGPVCPDLFAGEVVVHFPELATLPPGPAQWLAFGYWCAWENPGPLCAWEGPG